ncbi:Copper chaperone CopZ [Flavobacterium micromati]|jgi:copper chaperone CopZ|uniref:Copper chaperone CopZ n=1 Tax=Flavobacterium micromati TaxID=229205 RepID=A0A1M5J4V6_9FLAO|nr:heavy metal-associated domain-containing protein [Flavobacterium micromati]MCL6462183.1 heavy-metal-associated domain-containing protein [Flavobacterium micromati]SHG35604.1 Copper chaperone CopZ [Flavobacterium micromati]
MKTLYKKSVLIVILITLFTTASNAQISKAEIRATGLTCSMCSNAINKQLKSMPEVKNVDIDLNTNTFVVSLSENNSLKPSVFKEKVENAGFFIGSLVLTTNSKTIKESSYIIVNGKENNSKEVQIQILDKGYVTDKEFKKLSKSYKNSLTYNNSNENDFHIQILN